MRAKYVIATDEGYTLYPLIFNDYSDLYKFLLDNGFTIDGTRSMDSSACYTKDGIYCRGASIYVWDGTYTLEELEEVLMRNT